MSGSRIDPRELPDERAYRRSASMIGWRVMAVCAGLVVVGGGVILAFVFWQTTPWEANQPPQPGEVEVRLDPGELVLAVVLLATGAVLSAGLAARMIARRAVQPLDEAFQLQRRFVADASHELRTPLAVLGARAQQLAAMTPDADPRGAILAELRQDVRNLALVMDDMLDAATGATAARGRAALDGVAAEVARDLATVAEEFGVAIAVTVPPLEVAMPGSALRRCLVALVDNALDHSPAGGTVRIAAERRGGAAIVSVSDEGSGIRGVAPERVFDRFAHGAPPSTPRGRGRTGRGIGLALVRELCEASGGDVRVAASGPHGTRFELTLPLAADGAPR
ncbi:sensor histidine kinase [Leucobacter sp. HNU]|uniref:sensor histidine kinase n=1 Tax=Leucobacter sp. HNU TaxID=3236805 RepID=UPI003A800F2C